MRRAYFQSNHIANAFFRSIWDMGRTAHIDYANTKTFGYIVYYN